MQPTLSACCSARMHNERHVASALCIPVLLLTDDIDSELDEVFWCSGNCVKIPARELKTVESYQNNNIQPDTIVSTWTPT